MKKLIAMLLALVMVFALVACGGGETTDPTGGNNGGNAGNNGGEAGKITLKVVAAQYGPNTADWWKTFEADFEAAYNNVDLVVDVPSWNDIYTVVNTRIANNDAPDILNIDVFADYQADGLLLPAQDYVSEETYAKFYPQFLEQSVVDGTVWAVPDLASARALYYNADILAAAGVEVPTTWAELKTACEKIKAYDSSIYPWGVDMTTDEGQACFAYYAWGNGGGFVDGDGNWTLNSAENVEAVNYIVGLVNDGLTNTDPTTETRYDLQELFAAGKLAMMIGPNQISSYCAASENPINFGVASIPANEGKAAASVGVMDRFMVFDNGHDAAKMEAITNFFDFFYEDARYSAWVLMEDFLPATSTGGELVVEQNPAMAAWLDVVGSAKFYPTAKAEWADVKQGVIDVQQEALLGGNVQELLDDLQADIAG
ncbi:MAG: extracellular solute-binding protein [Oscillospiraceae bacterium]|nr:extracellular solute-binding protein [Oscillospiraceae bacterium]